MKLPCSFSHPEGNPRTDDLKLVTIGGCDFLACRACRRYAGRIAFQAVQAVEANKQQESAG